MKHCLYILLLCILHATASAQEATLKGKLERYTAGVGSVSLYVMGQVNIEDITPGRDGSFTVRTDLWERSRALLFWDDGTDHNWSCTFYLEPNQTTKLTVSNSKRATGSNSSMAIRDVRFEGANASLSHYTNLCYQTFEREMLLDSLHLASFTNFLDAQQYIESVLQPLGEALLDIAADENEKEDGGTEDEDDNDNPEASFAEEERLGLDMQQLEAEFRYALLAERRGQHMSDDPAFKAYIANIDANDSEQAPAIANLILWQTVADPKRYAPRQDEAAQLAALEQLTDDEDVRNAVADIVMQRFMLRVQMGENPADKRYKTFYETLRRVSTDPSYNDFIDTQLLRMEHPELFKDEDTTTERSNVLDDIPDVE